MGRSKLSTEPLKGLFIIESLSPDDEMRRREGRILRQVLRLSNEKVKYLYIRTKRELPFALEEFRRSGFRYLHISCHGCDDTIALTLDQLSFEEFAKEARPYLQKRRLFFSACSVVNDRLAQAIIPGSGCYSVVGPQQDINMDDALLMWASFYHLIFRDGDRYLKGGKIRWTLRRLRAAFGIGFEYYRSSGDDSYTRADIEQR